MTTKTVRVAPNGAGSTASGASPPGSDQTGSRATRAAGATGVTGATGATGSDDQGCNEVVLRGRLAALAEQRELPSGDVIVTLRVVVPRPAARARRGAKRPVEGVPGGRRVTVDTIDVVCWTSGTRRTALRLVPGDVIEVQGSLRRRFFGGPSGRQSRYEVESSALRRLARGAGPAT